MTQPCKTCKNQGVYYDRRCRSKACAHLGKKNEEGERIPVMECPARPCACKAGREARLELQERVYRQNQMLEEWAAAYETNSERERIDYLFQTEEEQGEVDAPQPTPQA